MRPRHTNVPRIRPPTKAFLLFFAFIAIVYFLLRRLGLSSQLYSKSRLAPTLDALLLSKDQSRHPWKHLGGGKATQKRTRGSQKAGVVDRDTIARLEDLWRRQDSTDWDQDSEYQVPVYDKDVPAVTQIPEPRGAGRPKGKSRIPPDTEAVPRKVAAKRPVDELMGRQRPQPSPDVLEADNSLCGMSPCRILMPGWIGEQESRAQQHFIQLGLLTSTLNAVYRESHPTSSQEDEDVGPYVLVLPNVSKSRMGSCFKHPFQSYYDDASPELGRVVSFEKFQEWVETREVRPKAQIVQVEQNARDASVALSDDIEIQDVYGTNGHPAELVTDMEVAPEKGKHNYCLADKAARLVFSRRRPVLTVYPPAKPALWHKSPGGVETMRAAIMEALGGGSDGGPPVVPDVLILNWELRWPVITMKPRALTPTVGEGQRRFSQKESDTLSPHLPYNSRWINVATATSTKLTPYLAIHWRMETVPAGPLPGCASALVHKVHELLSLPNNVDVRTVYLATDFPLEGSPKSGTWKGREIVDEHREAMRAFFDAFNEGGILAGWKLTGLKGVLEGWEDEGFDMDDIDGGILAILDKTIATKAELFVSGAERCGRQSSFTQQIVEARKVDESLRNVVDIFG